VEMVFEEITEIEVVWNNVHIVNIVNIVNIDVEIEPRFLNSVQDGKQLLISVCYLFIITLWFFLHDMKN